MEKYGYVRVSSKDQNEARQLIAMREQGIAPRNIYIDKQSGKDFERDRYRALLEKLREGDVIFVKSIDRLGRSYEEILNEWRCLTKDRKIDVVVIDMPLLDTRKKDGELMATFVADIVLQILSYVAQTERENIKQRQKEGIAAAKERGVHMGRPKMPIPEEFDQICAAWRRGMISERNAARLLGVSRNTFRRMAHGAAKIS